MDNTTESRALPNFNELVNLQNNQQVSQNVFNRLVELETQFIDLKTRMKVERKFTEWVTYVHAPETWTTAPFPTSNITFDEDSAQWSVAVEFDDGSGVETRTVTVSGNGNETQLVFQITEDARLAARREMYYTVFGDDNFKFVPLETFTALKAKVDQLEVWQHEHS